MFLVDIMHEFVRVAQISALHFICVYMVPSLLVSAPQRYRPMSAGAWTLLRHTLARFFQDRKVKVSIFLQDGIQLGDGSFNLSCAGALPVVTATPGSIRFVFFMQMHRFHASLSSCLDSLVLSLIGTICVRACRSRYYSQGRVSGEQRLDLPNAVAVFKPANEFDPLNAYRSSHLGTNMYDHLIVLPLTVFAHVLRLAAFSS